MPTKQQFEAEINNILDQLIRLYQPEKVILFGSLAKGVAHEGTDIDLLVIKEDVPEIGVDRIRQLDSLVEYNLATDFIVYKPEEIERRQKLGDPFLERIIKEGKVLYEAC